MAYKEARQVYLDSAIKDFNLRTIGKVICSIAGGEPESSSGYSLTLIYAGLESKDALDSRLVELGYEGPSTPDGFSYVQDDIGVAGRVYLAGVDEDERAILQSEFDPSVCSLPEGDLVLVSFEESFSPVVSD